MWRILPPRPGVFVFVFFEPLLVLTLPRDLLPWVTLPGADAPDSIAPGITEPLKLLPHVKMAVRGGERSVIEFSKLTIDERWHSSDGEHPLLGYARPPVPCSGTDPPEL